MDDIPENPKPRKRKPSKYKKKIVPVSYLSFSNVRKIFTVLAKYIGEDLSFQLIFTSGLKNIAKEKYYIVISTKNSKLKFKHGRETQKIQIRTSEFATPLITLAKKIKDFIDPILENPDEIN